MAVFIQQNDDNIPKPDVSLKDMTLEDLREFSNLFASQFNNSDMHDRVLCFEIIEYEARETAEPYSRSDAEIQLTNESESGSMCSVAGDISDINIGRNNEEKKIEEDIKTTGETKVINIKDEVTNDTIEGWKNQEGEQKEGHVDDFTYQNETVRNAEKFDECNDSEVESVENKLGENNSKVRKLFVHTQWLAVQSPYFKALFYSGMKESYSKEVIMKIDEHELQAHLTLIEAMYKLDTLNNKDYRLIVDVLVLAHKYDVRLVIKKCKYVLMSSTLTLQMCEYILQKTKHITDTDDMNDMLETFLVKEFTPIDKTWTMDKFARLSEEPLRLLLKSDSLATQSENTIFVALMKWIRTNIPAFARKKCHLLETVRFEFMSVDFLHDIVQHHYLAKCMPEFNKHLLKGLAYHGFSQIRREQLEPKLKKRPLFQDSGPTFSWLIDEELEKKLSISLGCDLYSETFWFQGYQMKLSHGYTTDLNKCSFYLCVLDLPNDACLNVSYTAKSNLFATPIKIKHLFTRETRSWGYREWQKKTWLVQLNKSYKIDVWVEFV